VAEQIWSDVPFDAGDAYEKHLVPAIFDEWAPRLLAAGGVGLGDRVLDVACGTGIVARKAVDVVGPAGSVTGLDLTESMLRTAARIEPRVDWHLGDAGALPFEDETFDVVLSQAGLMFFPDKVGAVGEMHRVLAPGGRVAILVWGPSEAHRAIGEVVESHVGPEQKARYLAPWSFSEADRLLGVVRNGGFDHAEVVIEPVRSWYDSEDQILSGSTAVLLAGAAETDELRSDILAVVAPHRVDDGRVLITGEANIATATKA